MPKVHLANETYGQYMFYCPGCDCYHSFTTKPSPRDVARGAKWTFNNDLEKPTFNPSLLVNASNKDTRCHLYLREGVLQFLGDCHHAYAGKNIECPEWD